MIDQLKSVFYDNRGVSPVIGVILMVAITVILAAVIGTFVLGLGGDLQQTPQSQISIEDVEDNSNIEISHDGGDALQTSNIDISIGDGNSMDFTQGNAASSTLGSDLSDDEFSVGESVEFDASGNTGQTTIQLIHTPSDTILVETELNL